MLLHVVDLFLGFELSVERDGLSEEFGGKELVVGGERDVRGVVMSDRGRVFVDVVGLWRGKGRTRQGHG